MSMNAVGIDVSKRKSTVAILRPGGEVVASPFDVPHLSGCFQPLIQHIRALNGQTRIVMECTGRYYEPVARQLSQAGFFVCAVNPQIIHGFQGQDNPLRRVKTDKADSIKIARYTLDNWANLKQYTLMDELRTQLKTMNRQFDFYMKHKTAMKNNLIGLIDLAYPGANTYLFSRLPRPLVIPAFFYIVRIPAPIDLYLSAHRCLPWRKPLRHFSPDPDP